MKTCSNFNYFKWTRLITILITIHSRILSLHDHYFMIVVIHCLCMRVYCISLCFFHVITFGSSQGSVSNLITSKTQKQLTQTCLNIQFIITYTSSRHITVFNYLQIQILKYMTIIISIYHSI